MNQARIWLLAARPRTLIASVSPVLIGTVLGYGAGAFSFSLFVWTLITALLIQITTNLANDYFDWIKGADTAERKGFLRVTQSGLVSPASMKGAILLVLGATLISGLPLIATGGIGIAVFLLLSLVLSVAYTGGPWPLAYLGLGEIFVFLFFGPVAVLGTYFLQTGHLRIEPLVLSLVPGSLSTAILSVNNLRDIQEDKRANKKTLAVRFGKSIGQGIYLFTLGISFLIPLWFLSSHPYLLVTLFSIPFIFPLVHVVVTYQNPSQLNSLLIKTAQLLSLQTVLLCIGWLVTHVFL